MKIDYSGSMEIGSPPENGLTGKKHSAKIAKKDFTERQIQHIINMLGKNYGRKRRMCKCFYQPTSALIWELPVFWFI